MRATSTRLLRLIALLQAQASWSGHELAARLGVEPRTVRRDIGRLRELGYPVRATAGVGGGYALGAGSRMPPVLFDDDEVLAVTAALRMAGGALLGAAEPSQRVLAKLEQLMPARLRERGGALQAMSVTLRTGLPPVDAERLAELARACQRQQRLGFDYRDHQDRPSRRQVEPLRIATIGWRWYLVAWDRDRQDWRCFRVDRIEGALEAGARFLRRDKAPDVVALVTRGLSVSPFTYRVVLRLRGEFAALAPRVPAWCGVLERIDEQHCRLTVGADSVAGLAAQVLVPDLDFEIEDDGGQAAALRAIAGRLVAALR